MGTTYGTRRAVVVCALALAIGCADREPTLPSVRAAVGGSGAGPTVTATDPDSARQDTTLDVIVTGSGFDQGSQAQWAISGVPSAKVRTNSTRFVTTKKLIANITIAIDADTGLYDVIVTASTGKKGIGSELFTVKRHGPRPSEPADPEIAYVETTGGANTLTVVNRNGSNRTGLSIAGVIGVSWGPGGNGSSGQPYRLAFEPGLCSIGIVEVDTVGGAPRPLNHRAVSVPTAYHACAPAWSPVADTLAFGGSQEPGTSNGIYLIPVAGGVPVLVYASPPGAYPFQPTWSPDGLAIAFIESYATSWALRVLNRATGFTSTIVAAGVLQFPKFPDWNRDGTQIGLQATRQVRVKNSTVEHTSIYVVGVGRDAGGNYVAQGAPQFLVDGSRPSWSPDGTQVVVDGLQVIDVNTGIAQPLPTGSFPDWRR